MATVNQVDDDLNNLAVTYLGQKQNVIPAGSGVPTNISSTGQATGTIINPGAAGYGGNERPGKRTFNPLSKLASYTYNISLYMITPAGYADFVANGRKSIPFAVATEGGGTGNGAYLIAQSGGINNTDAVRAPGFELDYYIGNLQFNTLMGPSGTGASVPSSASFRFTITEPYGFSFMTNLKKASDSIQQQIDAEGFRNMQNPLKQMMILGLRFYGYDINGNLIQTTDSPYGEAGGLDPVGNPQSFALFENYYDIQISNITFRLDGKAVTYNVEAVGVNNPSIMGIKRGRMPQGVQIQGSTVEDALNGPNGLFTKLNSIEVDQVNKKNRQWPNVYKAVFIGDAASRIAPASMISKSDMNKIKWPGSGARNTTEANETKGTKPPDPNDRLITFSSDMSVTQAIEQIIKQSTYIEQAFKTVFAATNQPDPTQKNQPQLSRDNVVPVSWFSVAANITNIKFDELLQDYAYQMELVISVYDVPSAIAPYSTLTKYYGAHKRYDYWFTGQNSEVLDYQLNFNNLYFNAVLQIDPAAAAAVGQGQDPGAERPTQQTGTNTGQSTGNTNTTSNSTGTKTDPATGGQRAPGNATAGGVSVRPGILSNSDRTGRSTTVGLEAQNSFQTILYDQSAYADGQIKILGDPDFLVRDAATSLNEFYNKFYDTDGYTVSANGATVYIEVKFNEAGDYKNSTGLQDINESIFFVNYPKYIQDMTGGAIIYQVREVKNSFQNGKFEQTLVIQLATGFDDPDAPKTAPSAAGAPAAQAPKKDPDALETDGLKNLDGTPLNGGR